MELIESQPLLEWLANNYKMFGATLEIITDKSQEGSQFVRGFGGIGGKLLSITLIKTYTHSHTHTHIKYKTNQSHKSRLLFITVIFAKQQTTIETKIGFCIILFLLFPNVIINYRFYLITPFLNVYCWKILKTALCTTPAMKNKKQKVFYATKSIFSRYKLMNLWKMLILMIIKFVKHTIYIFFFQHFSYLKKRKEK